MFQRKIDEIIKDLPNVFGIKGDILIIGYDSNGTCHDRTLHKSIQISRKENVNLK